MQTASGSIQFLKGVGAKRAEYYQKLGIHTVQDLLYYFPRDYIDLSQQVAVQDAVLYEIQTIRARLLSKSGEQRIRKGLSLYKLLAEDSTGQLEITIFNAKYTVANLQLEQEYLFYGRVEGSLLRKKMTAPAVYSISNTKILPIYSQTAGIHSGLIRSNITQLLSDLPPLDDPLPESLRLTYQLGEINACLRNIHFPESIEAAQFARHRFIFEELLTLACSLYFVRSKQAQQPIEALLSVDLAPFYQSLPYQPTGAQLRCIAEATADMIMTVPMNRLIQGDVGSGKTLVAAACLYFAACNKVQSALMVPTEILAEQHYATISALLEPFMIKTELLTGSTSAAKRREILAGLQDGSIDICIGTHALLSDKIEYHHLSLVITDEQHRFGVQQRTALTQKSESVHVLVMSATPIPRTLSLIIYGDLSLSLLDEMPLGRQVIDTLLIDRTKLARAFGFLRDHLDQGEQAYIVCPLIEQGEMETELRPAIKYQEQLSKTELRGYRVGLLHARMKSKEKEAVMRQFKQGELQVLVSTTVVEVGVDVPNATIIMIENAERFGLSQLHQLRGRVGRSKKKSYCILVSDSQGEQSLRRLQAMKQLRDGYKLAEYDLQLRGPGDFFGYRQHGLPALHVADLATNMDVMQQTQECAQELLLRDPSLTLPEHSALRDQVERMLESVGERPN